MNMNREGWNSSLPGSNNKHETIKQKKDAKMNTNKTMFKTILGALFALAIAASLPVTARADEPMKPMKGGEHLMMLNAITTPEQAEALKPGDTIAMACPKCKTIIIERVTTEKGHINLTTPGEKHLCSGCQTSIVTVGVGKNAHNELKHVCEKCGGEVFCCATSTNSPATQGMGEETK